MKIKWSKYALSQLVDALKFITEAGFESYANRLRDEIIDKVESLTTLYNIYPVDRFKKDNDGTYHAFEIDEYRVSYRVTNTTIKILRIRHTNRRPYKY